MGKRIRKPSAGDIAAWQRRKMIYERRQKGETQASIAKDLGISVKRVAEIEHYWRDALAAWEEGSHSWWMQMYVALCEAGVVAPKRSVVYGYA